MRRFFQSIKEIKQLIHLKPSISSPVRVCPVCFNESIEIVPNFLPFIIPNTYHCKHCDYKGPIFAEIEREDYEKLVFE